MSVNLPPGPSNENDHERLTRNVNELLQELRVAQTGVQILFAFLLAVSFSDGFEDTDGFQRATHLITTLLAMSAAGALIAPAAWHRMLFRQGHRAELVRAANRIVLVGLALMAAAMTGAVLLVATVTVSRPVAVMIAMLTALLFISVWFAVPKQLRRDT